MRLEGLSLIIFILNILISPNLAIFDEDQYIKERSQKEIQQPKVSPSHFPKKNFSIFRILEWMW